MENKFNWGTFILGLVVGAVVATIVFVAVKPAKSGAIGNPSNPKCAEAIETLIEVATGSDLVACEGGIPGCAEAVKEACGG